MEASSAQQRLSMSWNPQQHIDPALKAGYMPERGICAGFQEAERRLHELQVHVTTPRNRCMIIYSILRRLKLRMLINRLKRVGQV